MREMMDRNKYKMIQQLFNKNKQKQYLLQKRQEMTFRSLQMSHHNICIPKDIVYTAINQIGYQNILHFIDQSGQVNKPFTQSLKRCEENLVKIEILCNSLKKQNISMDQYDDTQPYLIDKLRQNWKNEAKELGVEQQKLIDIYQQRVVDEYKKYQELTLRIEKNIGNRQDILERIACLEILNAFAGRQGPILITEESQQAFNFVVAVINSQVQQKVQRTIYRVTRGTVIMQIKDKFEFDGLKNYNKKVIVITYPSSKTLQIKIEKVLESHCKSFIRGSQISNNTKQQYLRLTQGYNNIFTIAELGKKQKTNFMNKLRQMKNVQTWRLFFWKQKSLYECMNKLKLYKQFYVANVFMPQRQLFKVTQIINQLSPTPTIIMGDDSDTQPTAFDTNSFTLIAQQITNTYGTPRYKQINPSIFTIITFPFFFGVMFGDIAHGSFMFAFGIYLIFDNQGVKKSALKVFSSLRYMICLMGFFALYCGFIYNDFAGFNMNFFSSCFNPPYPIPQGTAGTATVIHSSPDCIYPFGVDPVWGRAENELVFVNSLKMKISVIIAIIHMTFGVFIKAANTLFFKRKLQFYFQFIPQLIFLVLFFGYMDFLIIFKWLKYWDDVSYAPSVIETMMNIGLKLGQTSQAPDGSSNMWGEMGNTSQDTIQLMILLISFLCVPIMLIPKPFIQIRKMKAKKQKRLMLLDDHEHMNNQQQQQKPSEIQQKLLKQQRMNVDVQKLVQSRQSKMHEQQGKEEQPSQIVVHQLIETIEFVLGAISNTASYLRLWALSLAHSQLTRVFFDQTAGRIIGDKGVFFIQAIAVLITSWLIIWINFAIIICMDSMQCFLHSLRLHWVQFQNKFYKGDGYKYQPFSFQRVIIENKKAETL